MVIKPLPVEMDASAIDLWHTTGLTRPWNDTADDLRRALIGSTSAVLAAFDDDALVGTVMVGEDGHRGWVYYLAVHPAAQGRGIGRALMAASESWLHDRGCVKLNLMVRATNTKVVGFYAALGYADDGVAVLSKRL